MKALVSSAVLQGPALDQMVLEAIKDINELGHLLIQIPGDSAPTSNPALLLTLMNALKIDLFWHEQYNGVEQTVVEADCTAAGPVREAAEIDAVAADIMTAAYRSVIIYTYGNEVEVDQSILDKSILDTGIKDGHQAGSVEPSLSVKDRRSWMPWSEAARFIGKKVLIRFDNGHIEDATLHLDDDKRPYYILFDGESLTVDIDAFILMPEQGWNLWIDCKQYLGEKALIRFQSGHIEDAIIAEDENGQLLFSLYDGNDISDTPVAAMHIPG